MALESPLDCKEIKPANPKGSQSWIFIGGTDAEAEIPVFWSPDMKNWLIEKDPDAGKDWRQEVMGTTEGKMVGWHHWLAGHEFEQAWRFGDGEGRLMCYSPCGCKESDTTERLNWTDIGLIIALQGVSASGQTICFNEKGFLFLAYQKNSVNFKRVVRSWLENKPQLTPD